MKLDFNRTYNNVRFKGWSKRCSDVSDKEAFIKEIKHYNPRIIIVSSYMVEDIADENGFLVEVIGMSADIDNSFNYEFIEEFFIKDYFKLSRLLGSNALRYWYNLHCANNRIALNNIQNIYESLNREDCDCKAEKLERLFDIFYNLKTFNVNSSDTVGLSSISIECLEEYNNIIENFKQKFFSIKDALATRLGIIKEEEDYQ